MQLIEIESYKQKLGVVAQHKRDKVLPTAGMRVRVRTNPDECTGGWFVNEKYLNARRSLAFGVYRGFVPGCGGDVWWIEHNDGSIAAYSADEVFDPDTAVEDMIFPPHPDQIPNNWIGNGYLDCVEEWLKEGKFLVDDKLVQWPARCQAKTGMPDHCLPLIQYLELAIAFNRNANKFKGSLQARQ